MKTIKYKSILQVCWREKQRQKLGIERKWTHLDDVEILRIRELRRAGNTLASIAQKFNRSISTIEKHTKDIIVFFTDFDGNMGKGGNTKNHPKRVNHSWVKMNKELFGRS
ncbi:hypothetical protein DLH72_02105 [Candidatus Gracilibacteria bacterium]|nr:MAG: hypothetical protein DLH72_02105 [Candidatus Gracilibacteria bacterium]